MGQCGWSRERTVTKTGSSGRPLLCIGLSVAVFIAVSAAASRDAVAQSTRGPGFGEEVRYAGVNAVLSGLVAGVFQAASDDGSFTDGFLKGAAGGAVTYVGKRVTARPFDGAGILGRQIASVGGSMVANGRDGRGALDRVVLQLGLGRLYWDRVESSASFKPDVVTILYTARAVANDRLDLDWSYSLSAGTPVFTTQRDRSGLDDGAAGRTFGGVILIDVDRTLPPDFIASHERTHVVQYDQQYAAWAEAVDRGVASLFGSTVGGIIGAADWSVGLWPFGPLVAGLSRDRNPLEMESDHLTALGGW